MISDDELLKDCRRHHSPLQMDSFITIRSGMTRYGCLHQALRELHTRRTSLRDLRQQLASTLRWSLFFRVFAFIFRTAAAHYREIISEIEHEISEMTGERDRFRAQVLALRAAMEQLDRVTFPLDEATMDRLDRERWVVVLKANAAVELMTSYPPLLSRSTIDIFRCLPRYMKDELAMVFDRERHGELKDWFLNYETPEDPLRIEDESRETPAIEDCCAGVIEIACSG